MIITLLLLIIKFNYYINLLYIYIYKVYFHDSSFIRHEFVLGVGLYLVKVGLKYSETTNGVVLMMPPSFDQKEMLCVVPLVTGQ